ncbi:GNAT family N-acetyltransferase [Modicisalibacter tunisiensis]|uniref:GNAT family N-acetyltransferase n=1 Tax=Modicisalibacter tunisiensis TaxID=390637 RepID=A0ABS7X4K9_9GAMM|nr:GNAT family N-acetyltransferase [Modicisalibacter tunisiensis]MBZ9537502.1 GNAT family N-acetyltransferase [Modicisalibacter tunisiensis]MBZ9569076.1 GNAT family N-acetyltransferase [Modicisalibacter tunisiensis]
MTAADLPGVERLVHDNMRPYLADQGLAWDSGQFRRRVAEADNFCLVSPVALVAFLSLLHADDHLHVRELQVSAPFRGRGVGTWLIRHAEALAQEHGRKPLRLNVLKHNPALRLYRRLGFRVTAETRTGLVMEKRLDTPGQPAP